LAKSLLGHVTGGPAKIAVVSSGFLGMISGSVIANIMTTGSVTIPMMKKTGYKSDFAGGVESAASTGGQLVPPVMGAVIFIMAEITGISYIEICARAAVPAFFYYLAIFLVVHFISKKENLLGLSRKELPKLKDSLKGSFFFIPIVLLVIIMVFQYSANIAIMFAVICLLILTFLTKDSRLISRDVPILQNKIFEAIKTTSRRGCPITVAAACIGIVLGVLGLSGVTLKISTGLLHLAAESMLLALLLTMFIAIIFGMGMDSITVYILLSVLLAPGIVEIGSSTISAHLFIFYFGMFAMVTPPVCLGAYAAAGIAESDPMKTGFWAWKLALAGFVLPFAFIYDPAILLIGEIQTILLSLATTLIGIISMALAIAGYIISPIRYFERGLLFLAAIMLVKVGAYTDLVGILITLLVALKNFLTRPVKREIAPKTT
jgi:TRAP transporter 4TM/12TM fusion protein